MPNIQSETASPAPARSSATDRDRRRDALLAATRAFAADGQPTRETCDTYRRAFYALAPKADTATRQTLGQLLAPAAHCPRPIALYLAMDVPAVAAPLLRSSPVLGALDMSQIIDKCTPIHARLLASRKDLPAHIEDRLHALNDADVAEALADRHARAEKPARPETTRAKPAQGARALEKRLRAALDEKRRQPTTPEPKRPLEPFPDWLERAAMDRDRNEMTRAMKAHLGLSHATCMQVLDDPTGDPLAVMMVAEGFSIERAHRIILLGCPTVGLSPAASERSLGVLGRLKPETCRSALAAWPRTETTPNYVAQTDDSQGVRREAGIRVERGHADGMRRTG